MCICRIEIHDEDRTKDRKKVNGVRIFNHSCTVGKIIVNNMLILYVFFKGAIKECVTNNLIKITIR